MLNSFASALAEEVRFRRLEERLTQANLADLAGVSERSIRSMEHGKPTLRLDSVEAVLNTLGLELAVTGRVSATERNNVEKVNDGNR